MAEKGGDVYLFLSSFRRRPESILIFVLSSSPRRRGPSAFALRCFARPGIRPCWASPAIPGGRVTFFACTKKVTKEMHPRGRGRRGIHAPATPRAGSGVCRQYVHVLSANSRASCARPFGLFLHLLAATWRDPGRAKRGSPCRRSFRLELLTLGPSVKRRRSAGRGRVHRTRCGPGRPAFGDRAGALPPNPGRPQRTGRFAAGA